MRVFFIRLSLLVLLLSFVEGVLFTTYYYFGWFYVNEDYTAELYRGTYVLAGRFLDSGGTLEELSSLYATKVERVPLESLPEKAQARLQKGHLAFNLGSLTEGYGGVYVPTSDPAQALSFAPYPFVAEDIVLLVAISLLVALCAMLLFKRVLRAVERELKWVEDGAHKIASGQWHARIPPVVTPVAAPLAASFNRMAEVTTSTIRSQQDLLSTVSHELRTPMGRLQLAFHLVASDDDAQRRQQRVEKIDLEFAQIDRLIGELLTWAESNLAERDEALAGCFELGAAMETLTLARFDQAAARSVTLSMAPVPQVEVRGNARLFDRAVGNLLDNALRYARTRVCIGFELDGQGLSILLDDDGPGIPPEDRARIFQPFVQLHRPADREGHGLGLAIARGIVLRHGGRVWFEDSPLGGSRARVSWPEA